MVSIKRITKSAVRTLMQGKQMKVAKVGDPPLPGFALHDNEDDTVTVMGEDSAGFPVDISATATLAVVSDNPSVLSVDSPAAMTYTEHGLAPGSANVDITATFTAGTPAPLTFRDPATVSTSGQPGKLVITHGPPVVRP